MNKKILPVLLYVMPLLLLALFCTNPQNPFTDADNAKISLAFRDSKGVLASGSIVYDTVGNAVRIGVCPSVSNLIDSITFTIIKFKNNTDSAFVIKTFNADTLWYGLTFTTAGRWVISVIADIQGGRTSTQSGEIRIAGKSIKASVKPTTVIQNPDSVTTLTVSPEGDGPFTYQWYHGSSQLSGKTDVALLLNHISFSDSGTYYCFVTDKWGDTVSSATSTVSVISNTTVVNSKPILSLVKVKNKISATGICSLTVKATDPDVGQIDSIKVLKAPANYRFNDSLFIWAVPAGYLGTDSIKNDTVIFRAFDNGVPIKDDTLKVFLEISKIANSDSNKVAPRVMLPLSNKTVNKGDSVLLSVGINTDAVPAPLYSWYHAGILLMSGTQTFWKKTSIASIDSGLYYVIIQNSAGRDSSGAIITVNIPKYSVSYNGNGNTNGTVPIDTIRYESGAMVAVQSNGSLAKTGFTFIGWNTIADGSGTTYTASGTFAMGSTNINLYAKWLIDSFTIQFNSNGGSTVDNQKVIYNTIATSPTIPIKIGNIFAGWFSDAALTIQFNFSTPIIAPIILYAKWIPSFSVTYNGNGNIGGSVPVDNNAYINGETISVLDNSGSLVRTGYTFTGWNTNSTGTGTDRIPGSTFQMASVNVILYAKWSPNTYTVTFDGQGATVAPNPTIKSVTSPATTIGSLPTAPTKIGFVFDGWWTGTNGHGTSFTANTIVTGNIPVYAKWSVKDIDGNVYDTVRIGNQTWMIQNFRATRYNDSTVIPKVTDNATWAALSTPGYCYYGNSANTDSINKFGALYNWYAINTGKLAPAGWHIPTIAEWDTLQNYLIANGYNWDGTTTGDKIAKSLAAKTDWATSATPGAIGTDLTTNNRSGFSALPGGYRDDGGSFGGNGGTGSWWSATEMDATFASYRYLYSSMDGFYGSGMLKVSGSSVLLVRNK